MNRSSSTNLFLRAFGLLLLGALAACGAGASDEDEGASDGALTGGGEMAPEVDDAIARVPWQPVGKGVSYKPVDPAQNNVLIIYGGYSAQEKWVQRWCDEMIRVKNDRLGVGHLYAVKGPDNASYANHEIDNSKLAAHLGAEGRARGAGFVAVIAHSSGTYVADELFGNLKKGSGDVADTVGKVEYFNLDGGGPADPALLKRFAHAHFVWAHDAKIKRDSRNAGGMKSLGDQYTALGGGVQIEANGSGCEGSDSGLWCMHDALINTKPHNPRMFDLVHDYTDFAAPRGLVTSYLDSLPAPEQAAITAEPETEGTADP